MAGDKTEKPTAKRRRQSRKDGKISRTPEIGQWAPLLLLTLVIGPMLKHEAGQLQTTMQASLRAISSPDPAIAMRLFGTAMRQTFITVISLGSMVLVIGVAASVAQGGMIFSTKSVKPDLKKLDPIKGLKRIFGMQTLWTGLKTVAKSAVVGLIGYSAVRGIMPLIGGLVPTSTVLQALNDRAVSLIRTIALAALLLAVADYAVSRYRNEKGMKMSKQEVKDEHKQSEGDPHVKGAIRSRQMAMSRQRMISNVAEADVLLVNPTHIAIALKYDPERGAPRVIARGAGAIAAKIRLAAADAHVPTVHDVPLARALYRSCDLGQEIPRELFAAVAQVLAFVISRRGHGFAGGEHRTPRTELDALPDVPLAARRKRAERPARPGRPGRRRADATAAGSPSTTPAPASAAEQLLDDEG